MDKTRDVAVIVGSLRKDSINRKVAKALVELAPASLNLTIIEIGNLPLYNQDDDEVPPASWSAFRDRIKAADAVLFVTPEYNRSVPAALKKRPGCRLEALWKKRMGRQAGRGRQCITGRHRRLRRKPPFAAVVRVFKYSGHAGARGLPRTRRQAL